MALTEVFVPTLGRTVKLGRNRPTKNLPHRKFADYLDLAELPPPPAEVDYSAKAMPSLSNAGWTYTSRYELKRQSAIVKPQPDKAQSA